MPRKTKTEQRTEEQQPALFTPEQLPDEPAVIEAAKRYEHQAKAVTKDEERAFAICEALTVRGWGIRRTCRAYHIGPSTLYRLMENLERSGKLETYKERIAKQMGLLAELCTEASIEMVLEGKVQANVLPIMGGTAWDKKALADGDPTARVEAAPAVPVATQDVLAYLASKGITAPAIDVQSTVSPAEPTQTEGQP